LRRRGWDGKFRVDASGKRVDNSWWTQIEVEDLNLRAAEY